MFDGCRDDQIALLATRLGYPVASALGRPVTDLLMPQIREDSRPGTLSSIHGNDAFPFHTETAHWRSPIDWVILKCIDPGAGDRGTLLVDGWGLGLNNSEVKELTQGLMIVKNGPRNFLAPPIEHTREGLRFRYDTACMFPAFDRAKSALNSFERRLEVANCLEVHWKTGRHLIFDNHRMLHARTSASTSDKDRRLERVYIVK